MPSFRPFRERTSEPQAEITALDGEIVYRRELR